LVKGETYKTMATRLKESIEVDASKAMRIVRTEAHRASETGKLDSAVHANNNGVITNKTWNSVGDERVRRTKQADHTKLNGKTIPVNDDFEQGRGKGKGCGMMGAAEHDINCRCFLTYSIEKIKKPDAKELEGITFEQWEKERQKSSK